MPGKAAEKITQRDIENHLKGNAVIGQSQHGFRKGDSWLSKDIKMSFHNQVTCPMDEVVPWPAAAADTF